MISAGDVWRQIVSGPGLVDSVCNFIIRPPRSDYELDDLGPEVFRVGDDGQQRYDRSDFELENMRGMSLKCSWFRPLVETPDGRRKKRPCVVYCHANCGSRYDSLEALFLLEKGFTLFAFDFCGSGMSDGDYISLGFYERQDLAVVVEYLHSKTLEVDGVGLWGRSMGAVTAVMYGAKDPSILCLVCDSPFASLRILIQNLVTQHGGRAGQLIPSSVVTLIVNGIRKRVAKRAAFDIDDLDTLKYAALCTVPTLIFHGEDDDFVSPHQSMRVQAAFQAACLHELTPGGHNDERNEDMQNFIEAFFRLYMIAKPQGQRDQREMRLAKLRKETEAAAPAADTILNAVVVQPRPPSTSASPCTLTGVDNGGASPAMLTGTVLSTPSYAEPMAVGPDDGPDGPGGVRPAFSQTEEQRPKLRPASGGANATLELGKGQTGPINFTKPRMSDAAAGHDEVEKAVNHHRDVQPQPLGAVAQDTEDESVLVDCRHLATTHER